MNNNIGSKNQKAVPEAMQALEQFKYEVANDIGVKIPENGYWGNMTSKECGSVGGQMVKRMVEMAEQQLIDSQ
ncbi:small, acid-soluble spore protein alpha [Clostridium acetireducens DSM 10703]|uniref:Small, acid-soluble spore protein alpha n=1 Tax=Clostridium acetireducens DSM 10703 TaxID=1121290 RepID=A0A1E8F2S0_9CLOT|nr:alpha/beta-type small acid-soluble spore protein [Clostridium acetireducens]OFI07683.1 small, acid-soluble spore protein alpha [Clostridium acetireducens DSM 10703]